MFVQLNEVGTKLSQQIGPDPFTSMKISQDILPTTEVGRERREGNIDRDLLQLFVFLYVSRAKCGASSFTFMFVLFCYGC